MENVPFKARAPPFRGAPASPGQPQGKVPTAKVPQITDPLPENPSVTRDLLPHTIQKLEQLLPLPSDDGILGNRVPASAPFETKAHLPYPLVASTLPEG
jgi:hypothetical protein